MVSKLYVTENRACVCRCGVRFAAMTNIVARPTAAGIDLNNAGTRITFLVVLLCIIFDWTPFLRMVCLFDFQSM